MLTALSELVNFHVKKSEKKIVVQIFETLMAVIAVNFAFSKRKDNLDFALNRHAET